MVQRAEAGGGGWIESLGLGQHPGHLYSWRILATQMSPSWATERRRDLCRSRSQPGCQQSVLLTGLKAKQKGGWRQGCLQTDGRTDGL